MTNTTIKAIGIHIVDCKSPDRFKVEFTDGAGTVLSAIIDKEETLVVCVDVEAIGKLKPVKELLENILEKENKNND